MRAFVEPYLPERAGTKEARIEFLDYDWSLNDRPGRPPHPVQIYESLGLALVALACRRTLDRVEHGSLERGSAMQLYLALYGSLRLVLDPLRGDGRAERFLGFSHQQGIALGLILVALAWSLVAATARATPAARGSRLATSADGRPGARP